MQRVATLPGVKGNSQATDGTVLDEASVLNGQLPL